MQTSIGDHWHQGPINAPTVLDSSLSLAQFWDGRAKDLQAPAGGRIANPGEMAFSHTLAVGVLESIPGQDSPLGPGAEAPITHGWRGASGRNRREVFVGSADHAEPAWALVG